ncbi:MAG: S8 family serine peptidase [Bacteroidota bacterium]
MNHNMLTYTARITCLGLILSLLCSLNLSAQSRDYTAKGPEGIQTFQLDQTRILVSFKSNVSESKRNAMVRRFSELAEYNANLDIPQVQATTLEVKPGATIVQVEKLLQALNKCSELNYAAPFLLYSDGTHQGILNQINVGLKSTSDLKWLKSACKSMHLDKPVQNEFDPLLFHVNVPDNRMGKAFDIANQLYETGKPAFAEVNFLRLVAPYTNDPLNFAQWAQENTGQYWNGSSWVNIGLADADMDIQGAWQITTGSSSIKVAVIDEGVNINHPDLISNMLTGYDATGNGSAGNPSGNDAHGTACAGIIAAKGNNGIGIAGNAYNCKIIPVRIAYHATGQTQWTFMDSWAANGINWAWQTGAADVLSNSWGGGSSSSTINAAILNAVTSGRNGKGAPVLFATGNDNNNGISNPAANSNVIAVGATSMCDKRKSFTSCDGETGWGSNYGTGLDIVAPGVKIATTDIAGAAGYNSGDYTYTFNGTSSATPNAAGVMALILSVNGNLTATQARAILESNCDKVGGYSYSSNSSQPNGTWNNEMGYGRVNAQAACLAAQNSTCNAPSTSQLSATNITATAARLNCSVTGVLAYDWRYRQVGASSWTDLAAGTANYIDISGLTASTQYEFAAAVKCTATLFSNWSSSVTFTTSSSGACNTPSISQLSATNITGNAARLNCSVSGVSAYDFRYRKVGVTAWTDLPDGTSNYIDISGLLSNTQYEFSSSVKCISGIWSNWSANKPFTTLNGAPANDNVCNPTPITAGSTCYYNSGNTTGATPSFSGTTCGTNTPNDIWYVCAIPSSGMVTFRTIAGTLTDAVMAVYWGSGCSYLTYVYCEDDNDDGNGSTMPVVTITGQAGTSLWVRVWGYDNANGTFGICALNYYTANFGSDGNEGKSVKVISIPTVQVPDQTSAYMLDKQPGSTTNLVPSDIENLDRTEWKENTTTNQIGLIFPNPASDQALIPYALTTKSKVQIVTTDLLGHIVQSQSFEQESGTHQAEINLSNLNSGIYILRMQAGEQVSVQQVHVIR